MAKATGALRTPDHVLSNCFERKRVGFAPRFRSSMSYSGIYLVEDPLTVKPSDCEVTAPEPHRAARYVLELGEAVVRRSGHLEIDRIECQQNSCLLQK
eukprot:1215496-Amphidinium_carterae.1